VRRRSPDPAPFFLRAGSRAVGLRIGAVDGNRPAEMPGFGQRREHLLPDLGMGPAVEAIVDRPPRAVFRRTVTPAAAALKNMKDAAQDTAVVDTPGSRLIPLQHRLEQRPRFVAQPERIARHSRYPQRFAEDKKSHKKPLFNVLIGF